MVTFSVTVYRMMTFGGIILLDDNINVIICLDDHVLLDVCARSCELGSHCCPNECIFGVGKLRGVGILE